MTYDPERYHRRSVRLRDHDYAAGGTYFVTICTEGRACLFGEVRGGEMRVNTIGLIVEREWVRAGEVRPEVEVDVFGVMPNHLHGLITIRPAEIVVAPKTADRERGMLVDTRAQCGVRLRPPPRRARSLSSIVAQFKASSTRAINAARGTAGAPVWQRGFYEHVVRGDEDFARIAEYIVTNPERWDTDAEHPDR